MTPQQSLLIKAFFTLCVFLLSEAVIIGNPLIIIGVDNAGQLNAPYVGPIPSLSLPASDPVGLNIVGIRSGNGLITAIERGCWCEGFAVYTTYPSGSVTIAANNAQGTFNIGSGGLLSGTNGGTTATTSVQDPAGQFSVTHEFKILPSRGAVEVLITVTNLSPETMTKLVYRRQMDWDIDPTPFEEYVSVVGGSAAYSALILERFCDNGFETMTSETCTPLISSNLNTDFTSGPADIGSLFDINLFVVNGITSLSTGQSARLKMYYGTAPNYAQALASITSLNLEVVSIGRSTDFSNFPVQPNDNSQTFFWGFGELGLDPAFPCTSSSQCNDNDTCTADTCNNGLCQYTPLTTAQCFCSGFRRAKRPGNFHWCSPYSNTVFYQCTTKKNAGPLSCPAGTTCQCPTDQACRADFGSPCRHAI